jgi:hypothetical protein
MTPRRTFLALAFAIAATLLIARSPATFAATSSTQATTRPAASGETAALIRRLSAGSWKERQAAQARLVQLADQTRPQLEALLNPQPDTPALDDETRNRVIAALRQIDEDDRTGPSLITIHAHDLEPLEVFADIARQAKSPLETAQPELWRAGGSPTGRMTFNVDRQPFWSVLRELNRKYNVELVQWGEELRLTAAGGGGTFPMRGPSVVSGPFLIVASRVFRSQAIDLSQPAENAQQPGTEREFNVQLTALPEPKLRVRKSDAMARLTEAVDDHGNSLIPDHPADEDAGFTTGPAGTWAFTARLQDAAQNPGRKIARLKGTVTTVLLTQFQTIELSDVLTAQNVERELGMSKLLIKGVKKDEQNASIYHLTATVTLPTLAGNETGEEWERLESMFNSGSDVRLLDARGKAYGVQSRNVGGGQNNTMDVTIDFTRDTPQSGEGEANKLGDPSKLVLNIPTESKEVAVPFEFTDLPIP